MTKWNNQLETNNHLLGWLIIFHCMGMVSFFVSLLVFFSSGWTIFRNMSHLVTMVTLIRWEIFFSSLTFLKLLESPWRVIFLWMNLFGKWDSLCGWVSFLKWYFLFPPLIWATRAWSPSLNSIASWLDTLASYWTCSFQRLSNCSFSFMAQMVWMNGSQGLVIPISTGVVDKA